MATNAAPTTSANQETSITSTKPSTPVKLAAVGQPVWFYPDANARGMRGDDTDTPFAAFVVGVIDDRHVNLVVFDYYGKMFPWENVAVFHGDDKDDKTARSYCVLEAPPVKEPIAVSGVAGEPIALNLVPVETGDIAVPAPSLATVTFMVPGANTFTFASVKAGISQTFTASPKKQVLTVTAPQLAAGALTDMTLTVANDGEVSLTIVATDGPVNGMPGKKHRTIEIVTVAPAAPTQPVAAESTFRDGSGDPNNPEANTDYVPPLRPNPTPAAPAARR